MDYTPNIAVVLGTARTGRKSEHVAQYIVDTIHNLDVGTVTLRDVRDYMQDRTIPDWQPDGETEVTSAWRAVAAEADAFIMVVPEYNHGYPGEWKIVIDQASKEYVGKPVITVSVSAGPFMGARMTEHIRPILTRLGLVSIHAPVYVGNVSEFVTMDTAARDAMYKDRIERAVTTLLTYESRLHGIQEELRKST